MSLSRLSTVAAQRDTGPPRRAKRKPGSKQEAEATERQNFAGLLVAAIPTEPLALYTFVVGGIVATIDRGESERLGLRWGIYAATIVFIALWLALAYRRRPASQRKRAFPLVETLSGVGAFAAWGLVMPESPLNAELSGDDRVVATLLITAAGVALITVLTGSMKKPAK